MIAETAAGVDRVRSVSSMRSRKMPPWCRAKSQLKSAVRAPPMCRKPVGEGAKRTVTVIPGGWGAAEPISTIGQLVVAKHLAQAGLHQLPCRGVGKLASAAPKMGKINASCCDLPAASSTAIKSAALGQPGGLAP